jgi:hypothetical protein
MAAKPTPEPSLLKQGKAFHKQAQSSWRKTVAGRVGTEKQLVRRSGRKGRMDLHVEAGNGVSALVEIKNSEKDRMTDEAVRRNVREQVAVYG